MAPEVAEDTRPIGARVTMDMLGLKTEPRPVSWSEKDAMLYALGVGASQDDLSADLQLTTENSRGVRLKTLPSFLTVIPMSDRPPAITEIEVARLLHAEQMVEILRPIPPAGTGFGYAEVTQILDKGANALIGTTTTLLDEAREPIARTTNLVFVRGAGGFGGPRGTTSAPPLPDRAPDARMTYRTRADQALLYRLNGDRNPLHSDPVQARAQGFDRPILHGMCTYGFACRALVAGAAGGDPERLAMMAGRFVKPVHPGETLTTEIWLTGGGQVQFRLVDGQGDAVLDRGTARVKA